MPKSLYAELLFIGLGAFIKFFPQIGRDTILVNGVSENIITRLQCVTAMLTMTEESIEVIVRV